MRVQDRAYSVRIVFHKEEDKKPEEQRFRCLIARSAQGAITKGLLRSRRRNAKHENFGCTKLTVEVTCLGAVDR